MNAQEQLRLLKRGTIHLVSDKELLQKIENSIGKKKKLRIKLGVDPTAPDIHLGHTVVLRKLRQFQDLGHQAVLIIGDYTALVGDPSGTQKTRPQLSESDIQKNAKTYFEQVQKILDMKHLEVRYNSEWFKKMTFVDVIKLSSRMTVARMLERDDFSTRYKKGTPICIHEFIYPLMQGYDSLMVESDVELGGTDQLFNLLVGRQLQAEESKDSQVILTTPLLEGTDGIQKMSKSLNNYIGVTDPPNEIYGKLMSISDELMWKYYDLLSEMSLDELTTKKEKAKRGEINPKTLKEALAFEMVERFFSKKEASAAAKEFEKIFQEKKAPTDIEEVILSIKEPTISLVQLVVLAKCASSNSEARRLIEQGAVSLDGKRLEDVKVQLNAKGEVVLKVGKRKFKRIRFNI